MGLFPCCGPPDNLIQSHQSNANASLQVSGPLVGSIEGLSGPGSSIVRSTVPDPATPPSRSPVISSSSRPLRKVPSPNCLYLGYRDPARCRLNCGQLIGDTDSGHCVIWTEAVQFHYQPHKQHPAWAIESNRIRLSTRHARQECSQDQRFTHLFTCLRNSSRRPGYSVAARARGEHARAETNGAGRRAHGRPSPAVSRQKPEPPSVGTRKDGLPRLGAKGDDLRCTFLKALSSYQRVPPACS
jgi:hypothetical protein